MTKAQTRDTAALVIDVQSVKNMDAQDAKHYLAALGSTLSDLRQNNVPVTWVTMDENVGLHAPKSGQSTTRDMNELKTLGFYGLNEDQANHEIFENFLRAHGPRENEAVYCKSFKSALIEKDDPLSDAHKQELETESGQTFEAHFNDKPTLAGYLKEVGIKNTLLMGAVSSHCIAETAATAQAKGFNPTILSDRVLSWQGNENRVHPETSLLLWRGTQPEAAEKWDAFTKAKSMAGWPKYEPILRATLDKPIRRSVFQQRRRRCIRYRYRTILARKHLSRAMTHP